MDHVEQLITSLLKVSDRLSTARPKAAEEAKNAGHISPLYKAVVDVNDDMETMLRIRVFANITSKLTGP
jgi:molecular chaperone GrpE (heat shock protein)